MNGEPTEQDQHELQTRLDMREAAEDALRMYAEARYATSSRMAAAVLAKHVLTLLDEIEASEQTKHCKRCGGTGVMNVHDNEVSCYCVENKR